MKSFTDFMLFFSKDSNREKIYIPILVNKKIFSLIILIFLFYTVPLKAIENPSNFKFEVNKINYQSGFIPSSPHGFFTVSFTPGQEGKYLSVLAENNSENISGFIVENMYLPPIDIADSNTEFSTSFLLSKVSLSLKLPIKLTLTAYITDFPDYFPFQNDSIAGITTVDVTEIIYDIGIVKVHQIQIPNAPVIVQQQPVGDSLPLHVYRREMDNIDLDSSGHPATATYAGDAGACAPAATANSFKWLEKTYPNVKLPEDMTLRKTLEEMSKWMLRKNNDGPTDIEMIQGKLAFILAFKLPVEVKFQCEGIDEDIETIFGTAKNLKKMDEKPGWDFLKQMILEGEDVEITFSWKDSTGQSDSVAHSVVVTGILEYESGRKVISYKHDTYQRCKGGLREEGYTISKDSAGWTRFGPNNEYYLTCIIAESPKGSEFNQRTAVFVNEFQALTQSAEDEFIEIVANKNIPDLQEYEVTIYNSSGEEVINTTLDKFKAGESADSFRVYSYSFEENVLPDQRGGIGLAFIGSPIPESFVSWGGAVTAVNGDWTGLTSTDLGIAPIVGNSYALAGTGTSYNDFQWVSNPSPSPGMLNSSQTTPVELTSSAAILKYELAQNYPNPFNPISNFEFRIGDLGVVTLKVYDILGKEVATIIDEEKQAGEYTIRFDASSLASGIYYYTLKAGSFVDTKKMVVLK